MQTHSIFLLRVQIYPSQLLLSCMGSLPFNRDIEAWDTTTLTRSFFKSGSVEIDGNHQKWWSPSCMKYWFVFCLVLDEPFVCAILEHSPQCSASSCISSVVYWAAVSSIDTHFHDCLNKHLPSCLWDKHFLLGGGAIQIQILVWGNTFFSLSQIFF